MSDSQEPLGRREQKNRITRREILDAAVDRLIEAGFAGATTSAIQERAGVSRGRLLHHYPSREALLVAAAEHLAAERIEATTARVLIQTPPTPDRARIRQTVELMWLSFHEPHFWAALELWTAARTNAWVAETLRPAERELGRAIRSKVDRMWGPELTGRPHYAAVRDVLFTSMRGAALAYSFDDRRDPLSDPHLDQWATIVCTVLHVD